MTVVSNDISVTTDDIGSFNSPLWRFFIANRAGEGLTDFSKLATDRVVEVILNGPLSISGTVPSDNPQVYIPRATNGDPYLSEGTSLMWAFRRESATPPYYVVRGAGLVQLVQDSAQQDIARTSFAAHDPWRYLFSRPICDTDGTLPGPDGLTYPAGMEISEVIGTLLANTIINQGHTYIDAGVTYIGTGFYTGTLETGAGMQVPVGGITFQQGLSVGEAWQQITNNNICDIVLDPIYDPRNRPNYLVQLNVYAQAGSTRDEQIFAWNAPGRSLVALERQEDGVGRANQIIFFTGIGGVFDSPSIPIASDSSSTYKYGQYWAQQFFPGQFVRLIVQSLAERQLSLRRAGRTTVTIKPAPERSPRPWQDYSLGDRVPVWALPEGFRKLLGPGPFTIISASNGTSSFLLDGDLESTFTAGTQILISGTVANDGGWEVVSSTFGGTNTTVVVTSAPATEGAGGTITVEQYQRIYGWTANISDDALETIDPLLTSGTGFA